MSQLELIKAFQSEVFVHFLDGLSLEECYDAVANIANHWLDVLDNCGDSLETDELVGLISENKSMSRQLEDYGDQKGTSLTTAKRLGEFLGKEMVKDKGLNCKFIIAEKPFGAPVTERAIPTAIWQAEPAVMKTYLRRWLKDSTLDDFDIRSILDWDYYRTRLVKTVQKIITIPAALQGVANPVPRIAHPEWLSKIVKAQNDSHKQVSITSLFTMLDKGMKPVNQFDSTVALVERSNGDGSGSGNGNGNKKFKKSLQSSSLVAITPESDKNLPPPTLAESPLSIDEYQRWLATRKAQWRATRKENKRQRTYSLMNDFKSASATGKKRKVGVEGFLKEAAQSLSHGEWQIVELRETDTPGEFILFVMADKSSIQRIPLTVPRSIYVDLNANNGEDSLIRKSSKSKLVKDWFLPHNQSSNKLYELTLSERRFLQQKDNLLGSTEVDGIYGMEAPLILEALTKLGNASRISRHKRGMDNKNHGYSMADVEGIAKPNFTYLGDSVASFKRIFYFHKCPASNRGIVSLFFMSTASGGNPEPVASSVDMTAHCMMWIVKPIKNKQHEVKRSHCNSLFDSLIKYVKVSEDVSEAEREWYSTLMETSCCTFDLNFVGSEEEAMRGANSALKSYIQEKNGPTFLITKTSKSFAEVKSSMSSVTSFPVVSFTDDTAALSALSWEKAAASAAIASYLNMGALDFPRRLAASRYSNIPLCNLGEREAEVMYDVFFARQLKKVRSLTWANNAPKPDLGWVGGAEGGVDQGLFNDNDIMVEVSEEGAYRSICFEIEIKGLATAAMRGLDLDENGTMGAEGGDVAAVGRAFKSLQAMVGIWWRESQMNGNAIADSILTNLHKLVCSPESLLYDPALKRVLGRLMHKAFSMLVGELQHLGAKVVFADFYKVIIATNKTDIGSALEYVDFLINTIKGYGDLVSQLDLKVSSVWSDLLFLDINNFEAVEFERVESGLDEMSEDEDNRMIVVGKETFTWSMRSNWNLVHFLAEESHQHYFRVIVGRFSRIMFEKRVGLLQRKKEGEEFDVEEKMLAAKKKYVGKQVAGTLTKYVGEILAKSFDIEWPDLLGSHLEPTTPALEFVKSVTKVFDLDSDVVNETSILRKSALTQMGMHEYSEESKWTDPCNSFILPNVFCEHCDSCMNLNLCVEIEDGGEEEADGGAKGWTCGECGSKFEADFIEWRLVEMMQTKSTQFLVQDMRCPKTNAVARGLMSKTSDSSIPYVGDFDRDSFIKELGVLKRISNSYGLDWLGETVNNLSV